MENYQYIIPQAGGILTGIGQSAHGDFHTIYFMGDFVMLF